jgi:putative glutamine amidotransferase
VAGPFIAVVGYHLPAGRVTKWETGAHAVPDTYVDALARAGGRPALLPAFGGVAAGEILEPFGGLLLIGGGDVHPSRYGADPHPAAYGVDSERDEFEIELLLRAVRANTPVLGICRGAQVMNVAFDGTLHQHLPDLPGLVPHGLPGSRSPVMHEAKVSESSRLAAACGQATLACASHHHQGIDRIGESLTAVAWSEDGLVEAMEAEEGWAVAVQWHPEDTAARDPAQQSLFDTFVDEARRRAAS